jgi:DNA polymerase-4
VDASLAGLVDRVARRMRVAGRTGRTVVLRLRFDDFTRATRSHTLWRSTCQTRTILGTARGLLAAATPLIEERGLTMLGIAVSNLTDGRAIQLTLPVDHENPSALDAVVDGVRDRYGPNALMPAVLLGRDLGLSVPLLPD